MKRVRTETDGEPITTPETHVQDEQTQTVTYPWSVPATPEPIKRSQVTISSTYRTKVKEQH